MENASKALIIAGAILIAILLIGIGVMIMRSIGATTEEATNMASAQAIEMFNSKFTGYTGPQSIENIKEMLALVIATNAATPNHTIDVIAAGNSNPASIMDKLSKKPFSNYNYKVKVSQTPSPLMWRNPTKTTKGYIKMIEITRIF